MAEIEAPQRNAVLSGPFWPGPVRVLSAEAAAGSIRIEAAGLCVW